MYLLARTDALELVFLQNAQQLRLSKERHLADLVQKERAALRHLDLTDLAALFRARERALLIAEEFAFKEIVGDARAVDGDERILVAAALLVDGTGDELLTGTRLTRDEHRRGAVGDALDDLLHMGDGWTRADDPLKIARILRGLVKVIGQADEKTRHLIVDHDGTGGYLRGRIADVDALLI